MIAGAFLSALLVCSSLAGNLVEELAAIGASTLIDLAVKAGLADTLTGDGPFTIFAPTNAAFAAMPQEIVEAVSTDTDLLKSVLSSQASNNLKLDTDR